MPEPGIIAWQRLQGLNTTLPNLLLSSAMSKLWAAAKAGCCSADLFLNTCQRVIKCTSLPSPGWGEELLLLQEQIPSAAAPGTRQWGQGRIQLHRALGAAGHQPKAALDLGAFSSLDHPVNHQQDTLRSSTCPFLGVTGSSWNLK